MRRLLCFILGLAIFWGCAHFEHREEIVYEEGKLKKYAYYDESRGKKDERKSSAFIEAIDIIKRSDESALPELKDLPFPEKPKIKKSKLYTGIIKNNTNYDLAVPASNSMGTITVPARGWVEYKVWQSPFKLISYKDGEPFVCHTVKVDPKAFDYMCKKYDFMAVIEDYKATEPSKKLKKRVKKRKA
jgi:hypothetical protein